MKILLIGNGAREHSIANKLKQSKKQPELFVFISAINPGIIRLSKEYQVGNSDNVEAIIAWAKKIKLDFAFIGPELPLSVGLVDALEQIKVPCIGPNKQLAQLETSKSFTRNLLVKYQISAFPRFQIFTEKSEIPKFIQSLDNQFVVKPDGLTGGKGVKVIGDHFQNPEEGIEYAKQCIDKDGKVLIEEKLIGQEFSLMAFSDGEHLAFMPPVQDHKRAYENDLGPNTGGMGSYSCTDHLLPFLTKEDIQIAQDIEYQTIKALKAEFKQSYKGILYGNFIKTAQGLKIIEYNARFGDPEAMNVLQILKTDLVEISQAIINETLDQIKVEFDNLATVCKYVVPVGYPENPAKNQKIDLSQVSQNAVYYYAAVDQKEDGLYLTGSRAIAFIATGKNIDEAEQKVEAEIVKVQGPVFHRKDIGTKELIQKRVKMMKEIMKNLSRAKPRDSK